MIVARIDLEYTFSVEENRKTKNKLPLRVVTLLYCPPTSFGRSDLSKYSSSALEFSG